MNKERLSYFFSIFLIFLFVIFLLSNYAHFSLPDSDFLAYIREGLNALHLKTDVKYKYGPLFSLIVALPYVLFPQQFEFSFYHIVILNILLMGTSLVLFINIFYKKLHSFILPVLLALFSNYIVIYSSLQPLNFTFFLTLLLLSFYLEHKNKIGGAIFVSFVSYFVRPEGILLFFIINLLHWKKIVKNKKQIVMTGLLLLLIITFQFFNSIFIFSERNDSYVQEIIVRKNEIPNKFYLFHSFEKYFFEIGDIQNNTTYWLMIIYLVVGFVYVYADGNKKWRSICIFLGLYSGLHAFFPDPAIRYSLVNVFLQYPFLFWPLFITKKEGFLYRNKIRIAIVVTGLLCISIFTILQFTISEFETHKNHRAYLKDIAHILNNESKTAVLMYEPWVLFHFVRNQNVVYFLPPNYCEEISCVKDQINQYLDDGYKVLLIKEHFTFVDTSYHFFKKNGGWVIENIPEKNDAFEFKLLDRFVVNEEKWAQIYQVHSNE